MKSQMHTRNFQTHCRFVGGSHARIIMGSDEGALIRLSRDQNFQKKSQRCLGVITGDSRHTRAHAAKSSTALAQCLRPIQGKYSRASHGQRQSSAKLTTLMTVSGGS
jgi:hypothetical protein